MIGDQLERGRRVSTAGHRLARALHAWTSPSPYQWLTHRVLWQV
jgi:hypothetical protein